jgi:hypothetical protein
MRKLVVVVVTAAALSFAAAPASASHSWGGYHWPYAGHPGFSVVLGNNLSGSWSALLGNVSTSGTVAYDWSHPTGGWSDMLDTPPAPGSNPGGKPCKAVSGRDEVCNARYGYNNWLGLAQIWIDTSTKHILKGVVKVNDSWFNTAAYNNPEAKQHVLCQEVGHTLGLDHQHSTRTTLSMSCMDDETGLSDPRFIHPNSHDYEELQIIYTGHTDSTLAAAARPGSSGGSAREVRRGRESLFVQDLANGDRLFTWVLWKDPGAAHAFPQ